VAKIKPKTKQQEAELLVRKLLRKTYPTVERAIDELAGTGFYGSKYTFLDSLIHIARAHVMPMIADKSQFLPKTIVFMHERSIEAKKKTRGRPKKK
jgi:hypothetical protein